MSRVSLYIFYTSIHACCVFLVLVAHDVYLFDGKIYCSRSRDRPLNLRCSSNLEIGSVLQAAEDYIRNEIVFSAGQHATIIKFVYVCVCSDRIMLLTIPECERIVFNDNIIW